MAGKRLHKTVAVALAAMMSVLGMSGCVQQAVAPYPEEKREPASVTVADITPDFSAEIRAAGKINSDAIGWLYVPGTDINEVILQNPYERDNNYYLNHDIYGVPDKNGTFCADRRIDFGNGTREDLPRITALYGHSWDDNPHGELFAQLKRYRDPAFAAEHPYLYFSTESENMVWEVFAVFDTTVYLPYIIPYPDRAVYRQTMDYVSQLSLYDYHTQITARDRVLTLSTCTFQVPGQDDLPLDEENDYRFAIMARLVDPLEDAVSEVTFSVRQNPMKPDEIHFVYAPTDSIIASWVHSARKRLSMGGRVN